MSDTLSVPVVSKNGLRGHVITTSLLLDARPERVVRFESGREVSIPSSHFHLRTDGTYYIDLSVDPNPSTSQAASSASGSSPNWEQVVVPVIQEEAEVTRRTAETGKVTARKTVEQRQVTIDEPTLREQYDIERVPINRVVEAPASTRVENGVTIIPVYEEEVVTTIRLILREEIHLIRKVVREEHSPQTITLRKETVDVERTLYDAPKPARN